MKKDHTLKEAIELARGVDSAEGLEDPIEGLVDGALTELATSNKVPTSLHPIATLTATLSPDPSRLTLFDRQYTCLQNGTYHIQGGVDNPDTTREERATTYYNKEDNILLVLFTESVPIATDVLEDSVDLTDFPLTEALTAEKNLLVFWYLDVDGFDTLKVFHDTDPTPHLETDPQDLHYQLVNPLPLEYRHKDYINVVKTKVGYSEVPDGEVDYGDLDDLLCNVDVHRSVVMGLGAPHGTIGMGGLILDPCSTNDYSSSYDIEPEDPDFDADVSDNFGYEDLNHAIPPIMELISKQQAPVISPLFPLYKPLHHTTYNRTDRILLRCSNDRSTPCDSCMAGKTCKGSIEPDTITKELSPYGEVRDYYNSPKVVEHIFSYYNERTDTLLYFVTPNDTLHLDDINHHLETSPDVLHVLTKEKNQIIIWYQSSSPLNSSFRRLCFKGAKDYIDLDPATVHTSLLRAESSDYPAIRKKGNPPQSTFDYWYGGKLEYGDY